MRPAGAPAELSRLIEQLGSPDYQARETATRQLVAFGSDAIAPLTKAAEGSDVETSFRAIGILQSFADGNDGSSKPPAIDALRVLATNENHSIASAADNALTLDRLAQRAAAVVELRNLGAVISTDPFYDAFNTITLDSRWTGKTTDFERLKLVPNLQQLQIINVPLDELAIKTIGDLDSLQKLDLFGTGISTEATEKLSHDLPGAKILRRAGGLLGVRGHALEQHASLKKFSRIRQPASRASKTATRSFASTISRFIILKNSRS